MDRYVIPVGPLTGRRIFVVEDDVNNLCVARVFLERGGAKVFYERFGFQTVERLQAVLPIDVILLDLMLPGGRTGYDLFPSIRALPGCAQIPIVLVTAADPGVEKNRARDLGFTGFISKPIFSHTFGKYISDILAGKAVWA